MDHTKHKRRDNVEMYFDLNDDEVFINYKNHIDASPGAHPNMVSKLSNSGLNRKNHIGLMKCLIKNHIMIQQQKKHHN